MQFGNFKWLSLVAGQLCRPKARLCDDHFGADPGQMWLKVQDKSCCSWTLSFWCSAGAKFSVSRTPANVQWKGDTQSWSKFDSEHTSSQWQMTLFVSSGEAVMNLRCTDDHSNKSSPFKKQESSRRAAIKNYAMCVYLRNRCSQQGTVRSNIRHAHCSFIAHKKIQHNFLRRRGTNQDWETVGVHRLLVHRWNIYPQPPDKIITKKSLRK